MAHRRVFSSLAFLSEMIPADEEGYRVVSRFHAFLGSLEKAAPADQKPEVLCDSTYNKHRQALNGTK